MKSMQRLSDLCDMLVLEWLVDAQIVGTPREMRGGSGLLSGPRGASDGIDTHVFFQQVKMGRRQQGQLDGRGKAAGIGQMLRCDDGVVIDFGQTVDVVVIAGYAEVLSQVDDFHLFGNGMFLQESSALAMTEAEEHHVYIIERHLRSEAQVGIAKQSLVYVAHRIASIALRVGKYNLGLRMIEQQTDEFAPRIACRA